MKKFTLSLKKRVFISSLIAFCIFSGFSDRDDQTLFIQNLLTKYYDSDVNRKDVKRFEINVTNNGFCRYKKFFNNGKQELFAFNLSHFKRMDYYGTAAKGELYLRTKSDDVIVQTRNDRKGDIDSMANHIIIPLKDIEVGELNALSESLQKINATLIAQK
jgi:hypothetical protein